jgi:polysaccharide pyruvyl transferase WcaK-like protein
LFGRLRFDEEYVCVGGSAAAGLNPAGALLSYCALVSKLQSAHLRPILVEADGRDSFLETVAIKTDAPIVTARTPILLAGAILANARLLISGRYHATIFASMGGTPSILLKTTAHKMESLGALLGLPATACFPTLPEESRLDEIVTQAQSLMGASWRQRVSAAAANLCSQAERLPDMLYAALQSRAAASQADPHVQGGEYDRRLTAGARNP